MAPTLGYWAARGVTQPIRLLLAYAGVEYTDKRYADPNEWFGGDKFALGLEFPNLPYYIDDDVKLTQSLAILRYVARKNNLAGRNENEVLRIELAEQQLTDVNLSLGRIIYSPDFETLKVDFLKNLPNSLQLLSKFLGERDYFAGENISYVDFLGYEVLLKLSLFAPEVFNENANLKSFITRIEALPQIAAYISSPNYINRPFNGPQAKWNPN